MLTYQLVSRGLNLGIGLNLVSNFMCASSACFDKHLYLQRSQKLWLHDDAKIEKNLELDRRYN